jgi:DNA-binding NarL/FixJ family response regulator
MATGTRKNILVVEGDNFLRAALEMFCSGYAPTLAVSNARDAIDALNMDLVAVILGAHHADGSGLTLLEKIRERRDELPVLVLTRDVSADLSERAQQLGANILLKSDGSTRLESFIRQAVGVPFNAEA